MKTDLFDYRYPAALIAQEPPAERGASRLMVLDRKVLDRRASGSSPWSHHRFSDLPQCLKPGDLLVVNNTKVLACRLLAGTMEILLLPPGAGELWPCLIKPLKKAYPGLHLKFSSHLEGEIVKVADGQNDGMSLIRLIPRDGRDLASLLDATGLPPVPPYIMRKGDDPRIRTDRERYQTIFAEQPGSAAAPTAGLHFTDRMLATLTSYHIDIISVYLHIGWDTFRPVRVERIESHRLHGERYAVNEEAAAKINAAKSSGRRIVACGTTTVRCLESAWREGKGIVPGNGETRLFITPGYRFKVVDTLITNFHQPKSTLLMMVSAFAGREKILSAYHEAITQRYRLFSYGDAMLIL